MTTTTIYLRFTDRAAALAALVAHGLTIPDRETGEPLIPSTAYVGDTRVDLDVLGGGTGVVLRSTGETQTVTLEGLGEVEVPVMEERPGFHVNVLWHGGGVPDFGAAEIHPETPSQIFAVSESVFERSPPVPASVTRFQAKAALHLAGLLDAVEAAVASADLLVQIAWTEASVFERSSPTIAALAAALDLSDAQIDAMFVRAAQISA